MCISIPGKVISLQKNKAIVDFDGVQRKVDCGLVNIRSGDHVRVQQGFIVEKISKKEAEKIKGLFKETT